MTDSLDEIYDRTVCCPSGCFIWLGSTSGDHKKGKRGRGYPRMSHRGRMVTVTREVCRRGGKKLRPNHQVDHICRTILCVRLEHLEPVTHKVNQKRRAKAQRKMKKRTRK